ncbi:MAG: hypothetical protein GX992_06890 [Clostridium sp.]|mgnify:CR=1 FL=1|nr:hypothetical protein [Clostridium sp.]
MAGKRQINHAWNEAKTVRGKNIDSWWCDPTGSILHIRPDVLGVIDCGI